MLLTAIIVLLIGLGILVKYLKQYWLIAGFHTLNPESKKNDLERVSKIVGNLLFVVAGMLVVLGWFSVQEPKIQLTSKTIEVSGLFGTNQDITGIKTVTLIGSLPKVLTKNNGSDIGNVLKGRFTLEKLGKGYIYATLNTTPYVYVKTDQGFIIINFRDSAKTKELYRSLDIWFRGRQGTK